MPTEVVVADTGPLIALARIHRLSLLPAIYQTVLLPEAVWSELSQGVAEERTGAREVREASWLEVRHVDPATADAYELLVDRGEAEAIALASSLSNSLLLIDEKRGRRVARERGLRIKGTVGVLLVAKRRGLILAIRNELHALQEAGIFVAEDIIDRITREAGE